MDERRADSRKSRDTERLAGSGLPNAGPRRLGGAGSGRRQEPAPAEPLLCTNVESTSVPMNHRDRVFPDRPE